MCVLPQSGKWTYHDLQSGEFCHFSNEIVEDTCLYIHTIFSAGSQINFMFYTLITTILHISLVCL